MSDVLFCTDDFAERHRERLAELAPDLGLVTLVRGREVDPADLERATIAFFSNDAWPERAAAWFGAATRAPNLRWLHTMSAGVDSPVFATFVERGVTLTNSSGSNAAPIARTVLMYLLALARDLRAMLRAQDDGEWAWFRWDELEGRSVAVAGWGPIGRECARLLDAIGMEVTIVRRRARGGEPHPVRRLDELVDVAAGHDALVVALPLTDDTAGIVSSEVLDALGADGLLVNVGRGELVDQAALVGALVDGRLAGAGLDVTTPEPLPADDPLWSAPNVIVTPHNSGSTDGTRRRSDEAFLENLARWVRGEELANVVEP